MTYRIGDTINLAEPPVGTVLRSKGPDGTFQIERDRKGWFIQGQRTRVPWQSAIRVWGPGIGQALTVVKLP